MHQLRREVSGVVGEVLTLEGVTHARSLIALGPDIVNLDAFSCLEEIDTLMLNGTGLVDLSGLEQLRRINASLVLDNNDQLRSAAGLDSLVFVERLSLFANSDIEELDGFAGVKEMGVIVISSNYALKNLDGLAAVEELSTGGLSVTGNGNLTHITGMAALRNTVGPMIIKNNPGLVLCDDYLLAAQIEVATSNPHELQSDPELCE